MKVLNVPGLESLGDDNILNNAASLKAVTKLRSSSFRVGVLTLANAKRQEGKSMPWKEISRVCGIRGRSHVNCCLLIVQKLSDSLTGCLCTIRDRICDVIFQLSNWTLFQTDGSCKICFQDLQTRAQLAKSLVGNFWNTGNMINFCNLSSLRFILNKGSGSSLKGAGLKTYFDFRVSWDEAARICSANWVRSTCFGWSDFPFTLEFDIQR